MVLRIKNSFVHFIISHIPVRASYRINIPGTGPPTTIRDCSTILQSDETPDIIITSYSPC